MTTKPKSRAARWRTMKEPRYYIIERDRLAELGSEKGMTLEEARACLQDMANSQAWPGDVVVLHAVEVPLTIGLDVLYTSKERRQRADDLGKAPTP